MDFIPLTLLVTSAAFIDGLLRINEAAQLDRALVRLADLKWLEKIIFCKQRF